MIDIFLCILTRWWKTKFDDRYTMKFFTDHETLSKFKDIYKKNYVEVSRLRRSFYIMWILVCLDEIEWWDVYLTFKFEAKKGKGNHFRNIGKSVNWSTFLSK